MAVAARGLVKVQGGDQTQERQAYQRVFAILNQTRDRILAEAKLAMTATARGNSTAATEFIQVLNEGRSAKG